MNRIERSQKFARKALALIESQGECFETIQSIVTDASRVVGGASDQTLRTCEWVGAVQSVKTIGSVPLWAIYDSAKGWNNPEKIKREAWAEIRSILGELAGASPLTTHARKRKKQTKLWFGLCQDAREQKSSNMFDEVVKLALSTYPDFDLNLLGSAP